MADNDDIQIHTYQDDLTTDENATDPIMSEENDDPTVELGVPVSELKTELDKLDVGDNNIAAHDPDDIEVQDDEETFIEAQDEDPGEYPGNP